MYSALNIARYIIAKANSNNRTISNLKIQKILYFVQAEFLVTQNRPCFSDEIQAWDFGPVIPSVYRRFKIFGSANIPLIESTSNYNSILKRDQRLINGIVEECMKYSAATLVEITHSQDPWRNAYRRGRNTVISNESIRNYFKEE